MNQLDLLTLARGDALDAALSVFAAGVALRLFEVFGLGRKPDLAPARGDTPGSGWRTVVVRSLPIREILKREPASYLAGYVFHIGLFVVIFAFGPHIEFIRNLLGFGWSNLPSPLTDAAAVATLVAMLVLLAHRLTQPVKRLLSGFGDYLAWTVTLLPVLTGYLAYHHLLLPYTLMLALHLFSVELLLVLLPFTKLFHTFSLFISRWYNGAWFARKGVAS